VEEGARAEIHFDELGLGRGGREDRLVDAEERVSCMRVQERRVSAREEEEAGLEENRTRARRKVKGKERKEGGSTYSSCRISFYSSTLSLPRRGSLLVLIHILV